MALVRFRLDDNEVIVAEVDESGPGVDRAARGADGITTATASLGQIRSLATAAVRQLKDVEYPDEIELEFGIQLTVSAGAVLARTSVDGHLQVRISWRREAAHEANDS